MADLAEQLRTLAKEAAIRSVPKLLKTAASEGIKATKKQAEDALKERVPAQVLAPGPTQRAQGKAFSESPESRYTIDLIDFSQNTSNPGYILVMMQTWSRRIWATVMKDKTAQETNKALRILLNEAKPKDDQTHDMLHDAGQEFGQIKKVLGENWVSRTKDPLDRNGIATLDRGIMELKKNMEDIIEEDGGDWRTHLKQAVSAYNRSYHSAVHGPPSQAQNGSIREFLIDEQNADNMAHNNALTKKRIAAVQKTDYFREATGAKRSFNQAYGPKLHLESVEPGGAYVKGSDDQLHLLKRILPVAADSGEPKGKLTQPRQYVADSLRDLAEDLHSDLKDHPKTVEEIAETLQPKLTARDAKIKTRDFVLKFSDLFKLNGNMVHALVMSQPKRSKNAPEKKIEPIVEPAPQVQEAGSSGSRDVPAGFSEAQLRRQDAISKHVMFYQPKTTPEQRKAKLTAAEAAKNLREAGRTARIEKAAQKEIDKQRRQVNAMIKKGHL